MILRKATLEDIPTIQEIAEEAWRPTYSHILTEEQTLYMIPMMYNTELISSQIELFSMLEVDAKAIGYCSFEKLTDTEGKLHKLYLRPSVKQKGAGTFIINEISKQARALGLESIILNVNKYNSAVDFYLKKGFTKDREMILDIGNGYVMDDYVMRLAL
jgi:N-acetylglutamate synthase-like GNAT family acetyltransferase